jgi:FeS assembly SUF system regulator
MRLTSLSDYAVVMLAAAARRAEGARMTATALAEETGIPLPTTQKLIGRLSAAGLLATARGTGGGFTLARSSHDISLADIVEAVEGKIAMTTCVDHGRHDCAVEKTCQVKPHWNAVNDAMRGALAGVSLASLSRFPGEAPDLAPAASHAESGFRRETEERV